jgi:acetyl esterase/lipase
MQQHKRLNNGTIAAFIIIAITIILASYVAVNIHTKASSAEEQPKNGTLYGPQMVEASYCPFGNPSGNSSDTAYIYLPPSSGNKTLPLVIVVHGGGWHAGSAFNATYAQMEKYVANGSSLPANSYFIVPALLRDNFVVAAINYRLAPQYPFPAQIIDLKCAVRYFRANAARYNINPNEIGVVGSSAGGQLVQLLAFTSNSSLWSSGPYANYSSKVEAVVDNFGPSNLTWYEYHNSTSAQINEYRQQDLNEVFMGNYTLLGIASPINYIGANEPPFLIFQGNKDTTVPPYQSYLLYNSLTEHGDNATLVIVNNSGHSFSRVGPNPITPSIPQIENLTAAFLKEKLG